MADVKTAAAKPSSSGNRAGQPKNSNNMLINLIVVVACIAVAEGIFHGLFGSAGNFKDPDVKHVPANFMGTMYSGGWVVPILMATALTLICFVIERAMTIFKAKGKVNELCN